MDLGQWHTKKWEYHTKKILVILDQLFFILKKSRENTQKSTQKSECFKILKIKPKIKKKDWNDDLHLSVIQNVLAILFWLLIESY